MAERYVILQEAPQRLGSAAPEFIKIGNTRVERRKVLRFPKGDKNPQPFTFRIKATLWCVATHDDHKFNRDEQLINEDTCEIGYQCLYCGYILGSGVYAPISAKNNTLVASGAEVTKPFFAQKEALLRERMELDKTYNKLSLIDHIRRSQK